MYTHLILLGSYVVTVPAQAVNNNVDLIQERVNPNPNPNNKRIINKEIKRVKNNKGT